MNRAFLAIATLAVAVMAAIESFAPGTFAALPGADWLTEMAAGGTLAMACAPGDGLAGALANGMKGCVPDPGAREWVLADQITSERIARGLQVNVKLGGVPNRDSLGRYAHVRGIYISTKAAMVVADGTSSQVSAYQIRGLYQSMHLEDVTGWAYFDALDGRDLCDDAWMRHWSDQQWPYLHSGVEGGPLQPDETAVYGIAANIGAGTYIVESSLYIPLVSNADGANPLEGIIPLAAIQTPGDSAFRFTVGAAASIPGNPTDVSFGGFRDPNPGLEANGGGEVWLDLVYLDHPVVDAPWNVNSYVIAEQAGVLQHPERITEYAAIRYHNDDNPQGAAVAGQRAVESLDTFTLTIAGFTKCAGLTRDQMVRRQTFYARTIPDSAISENNATRDLPLVTRTAGANTYQMFGLLLIAQRQRGTAAAGRINFKYATDPCAFVRYLHRTVACSSDDRVNRIMAATKCTPCQFQTANGATPSGFEPIVGVDPNNK